MTTEVWNWITESQGNGQTEAEHLVAGQVRLDISSAWAMPIARTSV